MKFLFICCICCICECLHTYPKNSLQNLDMDAFINVNAGFSPFSNSYKNFHLEMRKRPPKYFHVIFAGNQSRVNYINLALSITKKFRVQFNSWISISKYGGSCTSGEPGVDARGNSIGNNSGLGVNGGFTGLLVTILFYSIIKCMDGDGLFSCSLGR